MADGGIEIGPFTSIAKRSHPASTESEPKSEGELDRRIAPRNDGVAMAAVGAQCQPTEDGDVIVPRDEGAAGVAVRARRDDGSVSRKPRDADVQETAEEQTQKEAEKHELARRRHA